MSTMANDPRLVGERPGLAGAIAAWRRRLASGDVGQLPVLVGLVVIWGIFLFASNGNFFLPTNLVNLSMQMAATGTIAVGVVFVLLLGEIDLTVGVVSGLSAAIMAVLNVKMGIPGPIAVLSAMASGFVIGLVHGFWITRFGIPSFVVTLAGQIAWTGALLFVIGPNGTVNLRDPFITGFAGTFFKDIPAYGLGALLVGYIGLTGWLNMRRRSRAGLTSEPLTLLLVRVVAIGIFVVVAITALNAERGVPLSLVCFLAIVTVMDYVVRRTRFGRMVFAVGGNAEAARRAGIPVTRVRVAVFALASTFAAFGGVLAASRLLAVEQGTGTGPELLNAIAAAVIGGTSLFGGRGTVWAALLGILVIQSISNGMDLLSFGTAIKLMITGAVLLTAVTIDALARRGRTAR
jgi:D-xylose transport system permease protein